MLRRLVVPIVLVAVVACGSGDDSTEASDRTTTTADETTTTSTTSTTVEDGSTTTTSESGGGGAVDAAISLTIDVTADGQAIRSGTLSCGETASGTGHLADPAAAQAACDLLRSNAAMVTRLVDGPDPDRICTMQYGGPDEARITGEIDGRPVDTVVNRTDGCAIGEWDTLVPVVGPPSGML